MGKHTEIAWSSSTYNPWVGCHKVSAGCRGCYAEASMTRFGRDFGKVTRTTPATFNSPLKWREPAYVFTCSWSDFFIAEADGWRDDAWDIIRRTPHLTYQILTKRPERIAAHLPADWGAGWPNVWLGTTAENQDALDERAPQLLAAPAALHFLSCEPLLGPLSLWAFLPDAGLRSRTTMEWKGAAAATWVICGGESGASARQLELGWVESIVAECRARHVPVFVKQDSGPRPGQQGRIPSELWLHEMPAEAR